ncbi:MAG: hypothetical protein AMS18_10340 [Gemmatimonas sp. SG8_17]|nr:MAG: hypothetical protein AMS18_10340 [Gemmatimonas sp. SG8_17]
MPTRRYRTQAAPLGSVLLLLSLPFLSYGCDLLGSSTTEPAGPEPDDITILFVGSSYLAYNDLPAMIERFAINEGRQIYVGRHIISGLYLDYFASDPETDHTIRTLDWDYVVLQGGCMNAAYPETHHELSPNQGRHPVYPALATLKATIESNSADTRIVYMMGWAFEDGLTWIAGQTDTYLDMQQKIYDNTLAWSDSLDLVIAPVGWAWRDALGDDPPLHYLHGSDWNHPNLKGSYLSAAVIYATLFRRSVDSLDYNGGLVISQAEELRRIASRVVLDSLELWNNTP